MSGLQALMSWTFSQEIQPPPEYLALLIEGEQAWAAYKTIRDVAMITNKRIIIADKQGITGKKVEVYTIPFKSVNMYSTENAAGLLDWNSEIQLRTKAGYFKLLLAKGVDIRKIDRMLAFAIL